MSLSRASIVLVISSSYGASLELLRLARQLVHEASDFVQ
jgi:hypothetical protein